MAVCCRVISDDKENSTSKDDRGKLKTVKRKVKHLFGKADKEEENQAADFIEDDTQGALRMCQKLHVPDCEWQRSLLLRLCAAASCLSVPGPAEDCRPCL